MEFETLLKMVAVGGVVYLLYDFKKKGDASILKKIVVALDINTDT